MYQRRNRGKPQFNRVPRVFVGAARFILAKVPLVGLLGLGECIWDHFEEKIIIPSPLRSASDSETSAIESGAE